MSDTLTNALPAQAPATRQCRGLYGRFGKRLLDLAIVLMAAPLALPVVLLAWALMRLGGGPGLFGQERIGRGGRPFTCWKIRTMRPDAEEVLSAHLAADPDAAREWDAHQKLAHDPRITPLGRLLRRSSIDELPQLWNVLRGEMSVVGPRPFTPDQQALYDAQPGAAAYYRLRPGLTGPWQVSERHLSRFTDRVHFDAAYERDLGLLADLGILLRTVRVVLRATGR